MSASEQAVAPDAAAPVVGVATPADDADRPPKSASRRRGAAPEEAERREVRVDKSYVERPSSEALTAEQKQAMRDEGLL